MTKESSWGSPIDDKHCPLGPNPYIPPTLDQLIKKNNDLQDEVKRLKEEQRKYVPTLGELLDRLTIVQIKEVKIPEHKEKYAQEIQDILEDIDKLLKKHKVAFDSQMIRALIVLAQMNLHIWVNESNFRKGIKDGNNLELTHGLNGIRNTAKNIIQDTVGGRKDYKIDCLAADFKDWEVSWNNGKSDSLCHISN